uniref:Uncharacterized protein n=1 Tax=Anopheles culicifacies TaxID=139723 RepID=A0A182M8S2_9DIPT
MDTNPTQPTRLFADDIPRMDYAGRLKAAIVYGATYGARCRRLRDDQVTVLRSRIVTLPPERLVSLGCACMRLPVGKSDGKQRLYAGAQHIPLFPVFQSIIFFITLKVTLPYGSVPFGAPSHPTPATKPLLLSAWTRHHNAVRI